VLFVRLVTITTKRCQLYHPHYTKHTLYISHTRTPTHTHTHTHTTHYTHHVCAVGSLPNPETSTRVTYILPVSINTGVKVNLEDRQTILSLSTTEILLDFFFLSGGPPDKFFLYYPMLGNSQAVWVYQPTQPTNSIRGIAHITYKGSTP
jgi:hypothetical protein